jgi:hydrogenase maturation protein HypF
MRGFNQCPECQREYENPLDRRFHAQPNACPRCDQISLLDSQGTVLAEKIQALIATARAIKQGKIIAIKGLGGFHLVVDARNTEAVQKLRQRKQRLDKPFAVMYPNLEFSEKPRLCIFFRVAIIAVSRSSNCTN